MNPTLKSLLPVAVVFGGVAALDVLLRRRAVVPASGFRLPGFGDARPSVLRTPLRTVPVAGPPRAASTDPAPLPGAATSDPTQARRADATTNFRRAMDFAWRQGLLDPPGTRRTENPAYGGAGGASDANRRGSMFRSYYEAGYADAAVGVPYLPCATFIYVPLLATRPPTTVVNGTRKDCDVGWSLGYDLGTLDFVMGRTQNVQRWLGTTWPDPWVPGIA